MWKKIFSVRSPHHAHANTHWGKIFFLSGVWKKIFSSLQPDHTHANTHWRKTLLLSEMWKKIFPVQPLDQSHAITHWRKPVMCPEVRKKDFWLLVTLLLLCCHTLDRKCHVEFIQVSKSCLNHCAWPAFLMQFLFFLIKWRLQFLQWPSNFLKSRYGFVLCWSETIRGKHVFLTFTRRCMSGSYGTWACYWKERMFSIVCKCFILFPFHSMPCSTAALDDHCAALCFQNIDS